MAPFYEPFSEFGPVMRAPQNPFQKDTPKRRTSKKTGAGMREHVVIRSEEPMRRNRCTFGGSFLPRFTN
jgi:hypothetical protein